MIAMYSAIPYSHLTFGGSALFQTIQNKCSHIRRTMIMLITVSGSNPVRVMLADDDDEGREIFIEAIKEIAPQAQISVSANGRELMSALLNNNNALPDVLFLDLNMPLKNGQECLKEIRANNNLKNIPVVIYSTSSSLEHIDETYKIGANFYVTKPDSYRELKLIADKILSFNWTEGFRPLREKFVLAAGTLK